MELSKATVQEVETLNRRTMDQLTAKAYFYYVRYHELTDKLAEIRPYVVLLNMFIEVKENTNIHALEFCWQLNERQLCEEMLTRRPLC